MLTLLSCGQGQNISFDADYRAVLSYATTQGYTLPSAFQQINQNQLVLALKASGVWSKLDTFANFATDGSSDFALIDWKKLSLYTAVNSPAFTTNQGFTGNETSSYINTNFNPTIGVNNFTLNDASIYAYLHTLGGGINTPLFGNTLAGLSQSLRIGSSVFTRLNSNLNAVPTPSVSNALEMKSLHKNNLTDLIIAQGTNIQTSLLNSTSIPGSSILIFRSSATYSSHTVSMFCAGASLIAENTGFVNAYNTYLNSL